MTVRVYNSVDALVDLIGRVPTRIVASVDEINMDFSDGARVSIGHDQECCEMVEVEEVAGDWDDLIGTPLLVAEKRTREEPLDPRPEDFIHDDLELWTFYTFRSVKGTVDVRFYGSSNGYYSVGVSTDFTPPPPESQFRGLH